MKGVSIVICCYNSATRIAETLKCVARQELQEGSLCEVIVVDNASKDNTSEVAADVWKRYGRSFMEFKIVHQSLPGLSNARKMGLTEAKYDIILFSDDDNHLFSNYAQQGLDILSARPEVGIVGGHPLPQLAYYPGKWIEDMYSAMAIGPRALNDGYVDWVFGAGMFVRKKIYNELASRSISFLLSDRVGQKQTSGGDAELCFLSSFLGYKNYYCSSMHLLHEMQEHRLKKMFFIKGNYKNVYAGIYLYILNHFIEKGTNNPTRVIYQTFLSSRFASVFYTLPRTVLGKHKFFNFIILYQSLQVIYWLVFRRQLFFQTAEKVKTNLSL